VVRYSKSPWRHVPLGPRGLPLLGNALELKDKDWLFRRDCKGKYSTLSLFFLNTYYIVFTSSLCSRRRDVFNCARPAHSRLEQSQSRCRTPWSTCKHLFWSPSHDYGSRNNVRKSCIFLSRRCGRVSFVMPSHGSVLTVSLAAAGAIAGEQLTIALRKRKFSIITIFCRKKVYFLLLRC
jgi:hypothetical protein